MNFHFLYPIFCIIPFAEVIPTIIIRYNASVPKESSVNHLSENENPKNCVNTKLVPHLNLSNAADMKCNNTSIVENIARGTWYLNNMNFAFIFVSNLNSPITIVRNSAKKDNNPNSLVCSQMYSVVFIAFDSNMKRIMKGIPAKIE